MASVITITGEQLFAAKAQANEQLDIDTFIFANVPNQDPSAPINREEGIPTAHIVYQQNVQQVGRINDNVVVYSTVLDSITGPFEFNWVGLYSSVNQKLVAINHVPTVTKTATAPGAAGNTLNRNFGIEYSGIAELTGISVEPETWQLDFTARLSGMDKLTQQLASDMNGKDWFIDDGLKVVPRATANSFSVTPGVGYVSGLRVELAQEHILIVQSYPQFVYVDAWFSGNANSTWSPQLAFTVTNTEMDDYIDPSGTQHYVYKLAVINAADYVEDLRIDNKIADKNWVETEAKILRKQSIIARSLVERFSEVVNIDDFGAVGNALLFNGDKNPDATDDTESIQNAFVYAVKNGRVKVTASSWKSYFIAGTVIIPTAYRAPWVVAGHEGIIVFDFNGCVFVGANTTSQEMFVSGYFDSENNLVTNVDTNEQYLTTGTIFKNCSIRNTFRALRINNWVYGCRVEDVFGVDVQQMVWARRSFYTQFERLTHRGSYTPELAIYRFTDNNNIMPLKSLVTGACDIGYQFDGPVEALRMVDCGIEAFDTYGVLVFGGYNILFESCYFESKDGIGFSGRGVNHATFSNCWCYGTFKMFGDFTDNTNVRIRNNNITGGGFKWFENLPDYCISDVELPSGIQPAGVIHDPVLSNGGDWPDAVNINGDVVVYDRNIGLGSVIGRIERTNKFFTQRVHGRIGTNFSGFEERSVGCVINKVDFHFEIVTGIEYCDTQLIFVAFKVFHYDGESKYFGMIFGNTFVPASQMFASNLQVINENGKVKIITPTYSSASVPNITNAEVRLI
ncbi:phage tail-collar fiber domain-containing protein [Shewanella mangrovisoli]|uniref:phage tail-collar fiber domain-containing protein n=1 Tax=Shewanella mangrovisoli TaxID=2864211 RepID=UPI00370BDA9E